MEIKHCPSCGSPRIKEIRGTITREYEGETYLVPDVTYLECPDCGERVYDRDAVRKIQARSPGFRRVLSRR